MIGSRPTVHRSMSHFFYMDERNQTKVGCVGAVGPIVQLIASS